MANEGAVMEYTDDPIDLCRVYCIRVRVSRHRLLKEFVAFWFVVKCIWRVFWNGK